MKTLAFFFAVSMALLAGCRTAVMHPDFTPPSPPTGLATSTGDNFIEVFWNPSPEPDVAGYNVFVSATYEGPYKLIGSTPKTSFVDNGAVNGVTYYYAVTAYDFDGNESDLSKDAAYDVPRPEGYNVILTDYNTIPASAGFDFAGDCVVPYDASNSDMYFDNYGGTLYMDVYMDTDIEDMGPTNSILDVTVAPSSGWSSTQDAVLEVGHTYVVWTHDDHYAKFRVTSLSPGRVIFDWAYQLQTGNQMLKRKASTVDRSGGVIHETHSH